jgi:hypothetical protein
MIKHFIENLQLSVLTASRHHLAGLRHEAADDGIKSDYRGKDDDGYLGFEPHRILLSGLDRQLNITLLLAPHARI